MPEKEIKIGLALGGGGAKGAAHIGILRVLEKNGIKISAVSGASAGSVIGAGYALGVPIDEIEKNLVKLNNNKFFRISNFHIFHESLIKSKDIAKVVKNIVGDSTFEDTKIPFRAVAVDLETGTEVILDHGRLLDAIAASSAIPGIFSPHFIDSRYLVDGGLLDNVPVLPLRAMKDLDIIIGVEIRTLTSRQYISGMIWEKYYNKPKAFKLYPGKLSQIKLNFSLMIHILLRSIDILMEETQATRYAKAMPDIIIRPEVGSISFLEFNKYQMALDAGTRAAEEEMPKILALIEKKKQELSKSGTYGGLEPPH